MAGTGRTRWQEHAATTLEFVGLAAAAAVLLAGVGTGMRSHGGGVGAQVGGRLHAIVGGAGDRSGPVVVLPANPRATAAERPAAEVFAARVAGLVDGRRRWWSERRSAGGGDPQHVPRDDLRLSPIMPPMAVWQEQVEAEGNAAGFGATIDARACALCTTLEWSHALHSGSTVDTQGARQGVDAELAVEASVALASVDAGARVERGIGPALATLQARVRAMVGATAEGHAHLQLGRDVQDLELRGGAMAGAVARAEGTAGVRLLGVAITQSGRAEGWAGAGVRGVAGVHHEQDRLEWRFGWGGALGLGGATEWSGTVDISDVPAGHRRLARDALVSAMRASPFGALALPVDALTTGE